MSLSNPASAHSLTLTNARGLVLRFVRAPAAIAALIPAVQVAGGDGGGATVQQFNQASPLATWTINHNLGRTPIVQVFSVGGMELLADVINPTANQTQVRFASPTAGYARLI